MIYILKLITVVIICWHSSFAFAQQEPKKVLSEELYGLVVDALERAIIKEKIGFFMTGSIIGSFTFNKLHAITSSFKIPMGLDGSGKPFPFGGFPTATHGYNLGNYPESAANLGFGYKKIFGDFKEYFFSSYVQLGVSYVANYGSPLSFAYPGVFPYLAESWVSLGETKGMQFWGGMRAYKTQATPIAGLIRRLRGIGVGVENIQLKKGATPNIDIALITRADGTSFLSDKQLNKSHQPPESGGLFTEFHLDIRLEDVFVGKAGKLGFQVTPVVTSGSMLMGIPVPPTVVPTDQNTPNAAPLPPPPVVDPTTGLAQIEISPQIGLQVAVAYDAKHVMGYDNPGSLSGLVLQFGYGGGVNFDPAVPNGIVLNQIPSQHRDIRAKGTYYGLLNAVPWLDFGFNTSLEWFHAESGFPFKGYSVFGSVGVRPIFYIKENFFVALEYGVDGAYQPSHSAPKPADSSDKNTPAATPPAVDLSGKNLFKGSENNFQCLQKITVAPGVKIPGRFFSNPVISAFTTIAFWNENAMPLFADTPWKEQQFAVTWGLQVKAVF